jgi:hypothetical protein
MRQPTAVIVSATIAKLDNRITGLLDMRFVDYGCAVEHLATRRNATGCLLY